MTMIVLAMILMAVQDMLGALLVICESRGRALMAGALDAMADWPRMFGAAICGAALVQHGFARTVWLVSAVSLTSFFSTGVATRIGKRVKSA